MSSLPISKPDDVARAGDMLAQTINSQQDAAVMLVHLCGIDELCATIGPAAASRLVENFHAALPGVLRDVDDAARVGDRKFVVVLSGIQNRGHVRLAARRIEKLAAQMLPASQKHRRLHTRFGVAFTSSDVESTDDLMKFAEIAALDGHRRNDSVSFFEQRVAESLLSDWDLERRLAEALGNGDLELHYQPKLCLRSNTVVGAEALMRWFDADTGPIFPDVFIALAEATGQIFELTQFALQNACQTVAAWHRTRPGFNVAVNVTPSVIANRDIVDVLQSGLAIWGADPACLTVEITEDALLQDQQSSHEVLTEIRKLGVRTSIDDFGTGYSSLAYLKDIPADELKIDRSFVMGMLGDENDRKIVEHAASIAHSFGLETVAEGVECVDSLEILRNLDCEYAQGYYISKPIAADQFERTFIEGEVPVIPAVSG